MLMTREVYHSAKTRLHRFVRYLNNDSRYRRRSENDHIVAAARGGRVDRVDNDDPGGRTAAAQTVMVKARATGRDRRDGPERHQGGNGNGRRVGNGERASELEQHRQDRD